MKTYTPEEYKNKYGTEELARVPGAKQPTESVGKSVLTGIKTSNPMDAFGATKSGLEKVKSGFDQTVQATKEGKVTPDNLKQLGRGVLNEAGGAIETLVSPVTNVLQTGSKLPGVSHALNAVKKYVTDPSANAISNAPALQKFMVENPNADEVVQNIITIASAFMGGGKSPEIKSAVDNTKTSISNNLENSLTPPKNPPVDLAALRKSKAIEDATPNYEQMTPTQKQKVMGQVQEGGILKGRTVKPDKLQIEAGEEVAKIPEYNPNSTKLEKYKVVKDAVGKKGKELSSSLEKEKVVVPKREVTTKVKEAIKKVPEDSLLLQKSDPVIKNYIRVYNNALKKIPGTLKGVLDLRKTLDDVYENARGKQAFGSDKLAALDDVHKAARNALTEYLIEKASTDVKASLRSQWNLYRALDELTVAAEKESGSSLGRLKQKYPIANKVAEIGIKAAGLGAGLGFTK